MVNYLSDVFCPKDLGIAKLLMNQSNHGYQLTMTDKLAQAAQAALNQSYVPYSNAYHRSSVRRRR